MFDLYTHATPNGFKITIALEELDLPYTPHLVDMREGEQFSDKIVGMNPNAKIPILKDNETGVAVYESSAILLYLAEKTGKLFPKRESGAAYWDGIQQLFFSSASIGPMFGQRMHFSYLAPEKVDYGITRYEVEGARLQKVADQMLDGRDFFLGDKFSIVDIGHFGWLNTARLAGYEDKAETPNLSGWLDRVAARPAVHRGLGVPMRRDPSQLPPRKTVG